MELTFLKNILSLLYRFYDNNSQKTLVDYIALADVVIPADEIEIFNQNATWRRKTLTNYTVRELQVSIFADGECVYELPSLEDVRQYSKTELESIWDEVKRLHYPQTYYVDLSQKLYDLKLELIHSNEK